MIRKLLRTQGKEVKIEKRQKTGGGYVGAKETTEPFASVKGILSYLSGEEQIKNDKLQIVATHKLYLDYRNDLDTSMIILIDSKKYEISYINNPMNFNKFLTVYLKESD